MNIFVDNNPTIVLSYGGEWDSTKVVSPDVTQSPSGEFVMSYVGSNCLPHERTGYTLLTAESEDGVNFNKQGKPILSAGSKDHKHYSPCIRKWNGDSLLFYGRGADGVYTINIARSKNNDEYTPDGTPAVNVTDRHHRAAVHSPKVIIGEDNTLTCYYTGSHKSNKIYSRQFPEYDFADSFGLFRSKSKDSYTFSKPEQVKIKNAHFKNIYGHNVLKDNYITYLVFAGFDGSVNRLYIACSLDGLNFGEPKLLVAPNHSKQELGVYSSCLVKTNDNKFNLYYGCRYFDNRWKILMRTIQIL